MTELSGALVGMSNMPWSKSLSLCTRSSISSLLSSHCTTTCRVGAPVQETRRLNNPSPRCDDAEQILGNDPAPVRPGCVPFKYCTTNAPVPRSACQRVPRGIFTDQAEPRHQSARQIIQCSLRHVSSRQCTGAAAQLRGRPFDRGMPNIAKRPLRTVRTIRAVRALGQGLFRRSLGDLTNAV